MLNPARLFRLLNELVFILLGLLLVWVAMTGRYFFNRRAPSWIVLGVVLILWGARAWRPRLVAPGLSAAPQIVRGASLVLVGAMMLGIAWLPFQWVAPLLGSAGVILALRGLVSAVLALRPRAV